LCKLVSSPLALARVRLAVWWVAIEVEFLILVWKFL